MGLSRILKSFSAISFTWFYLFIMLENAEAKIGRHNNAVHVGPMCTINRHVYLTIIITLYLHNAGGRKLQLNR